MKLDITLKTIDATSYTKFKGISVEKLVNYLNKKYSSSVNKNVNEATAVLGKRSFNKQSKQANTNDNI